MSGRTNREWIDLLNTIYNTTQPNASTSLSISSIRTITKSEPDLIPIPLDKLFELYGNLILVGFEKDEALSIVNTVVTNAERTA
jgi:hypothetical protein